MRKSDSPDRAVKTLHANEYDAWFCKQVALGLKQANGGGLLASQEVEAKFAAKREAIRKRIARG